MDTKAENSICDIYTPIKDCVPDKTYNQIFLIDKIMFVSKTSNGKPYARLSLKDVTGTIEGVVWNWKNNIKAGDFVTCKIDTSLYKERLEFACSGAFIKYDGVPVNLHDYVFCVSDSLVESAKQYIQTCIDQVDDEHYKNILGCAISSLDLIFNIQNSPYGIEGPLAYKGGLLLHTYHSLKLANQFIRQAKELEAHINASLIICGCIFRNIGWHTTTHYVQNQLLPRDAYFMTGIDRASMRYINHLIIHAESILNIQIPEAKKQALENLCNIVPDIKTLEGKIVAAVNDSCDLLFFGAAELKGQKSGNWTQGFFTGHTHE
jgi:hypothetical protein